MVGAGVTYLDSLLSSKIVLDPQQKFTGEKEGNKSVQTKNNEGKEEEETHTMVKVREPTFLVDTCGIRSQHCITGMKVGSSPAKEPCRGVCASTFPPASSQGHAHPTAVEQGNTMLSSSISLAARQQEPSPEVPRQTSRGSGAPAASATVPRRSSSAEEKELLTVDTSLNPTATAGQSITAKRHREVLLARKARKDKFFSRVTFSNPDNKYYSNLPVQPAMGWWKSVLASRSHSLHFASRLARSLNVPIPDTVYSCSTDCFYVSTRSDALQCKTDLEVELRANAPPRNGWYIRSEFSAAKILEGNLGARLSQEQLKYTKCSQDLPASPSASGCPASTANHNGEKMGEKGSTTLGSLHRRKFEVTRRTSHVPSFRANLRCANVSTPDSSDNALPRADAYPAAVVKQLHYMRKDCNITKAVDLATFCSISSDTSVERLYQAFVRGKSRRRCQLTRVCWSASRAPSGFTLVNKFTPSSARQHGGDLTSQFCVSCDNPVLNAVSRSPEEEDARNADRSQTSFDVIPVAGSSLEAAADIARAIFHFTQNLFKVWLDRLVVDLIRGARDGAWYFLQVKSFTLRPTSPSVCPSRSPSGRRETFDDGEEEWAHEKGAARLQNLAKYSIPTICHMCGLRRKKHELVKVLNQRMMLETQHHMRKRGLDVFFFTPGGRLQLSSNCPVCSLCYSLYLAEKELIEVELELARALRQPMVEDNEVFFSFIGVMDAIQCTLQPSDPYLVDLMRAFSNAPPRQKSLDRLELGGSAGGQIELRFGPVRERDSVLSFGNVCDERSPGMLDSRCASPTGSVQRKSILHTASFNPNAAGGCSLEAGGIFGTNRHPVSAMLPSSSNSAYTECTPDTVSAAAVATASAASAVRREGTRFVPVFSAQPSSALAPSKIPHSIPIGSTLVAPPKQTMRGGEAVASRNEKLRQIPTTLYQWRMMLFLHSLQDLPRGLLQPKEGSAARLQQHAENFAGEDTSELVIEVNMFGESRAIIFHASQVPADSVPPGRARSAPGVFLQSAAAASSCGAVRAQSSEFSAAAAGPVSGNDINDITQGNCTRPSSAAPRGRYRGSVKVGSAQYVPIKRMIVFYLFSAKPCLQQIFQQEILQFRLLASSRAAASAEAENSRWCSCVSSSPVCSTCPQPLPPTSLLTAFPCKYDTVVTSTAPGHSSRTGACYETTESCSPLCFSSAASSCCYSLPMSTVRSCIHSSSCAHLCTTPATPPDLGESLRPCAAAVGDVLASSALVSADKTSATGETCSECGRWQRPPCLHTTAATGTAQAPGSTDETSRTSCSQIARDGRPATAAPEVVDNSQHNDLTKTVHNGTATYSGRSNSRPASAFATALGGYRGREGSRSRNPHRPRSCSSASRRGDFCEVAAGSCSLQRLAGVKRSKQQTYVLLFSKTCWAQPRLRLVLGLQQDMQIPSQYVCVHPYADAYLPTRPYTSPCPLPSEWLDCYSAPSTGAGHPSSNSSSSTGGGRGSAIAGGARPVSAYTQQNERYTCERIVFSARRPL